MDLAWQKVADWIKSSALQPCEGYKQDKMDATWTSNQLARSWSSPNWIVLLNPPGGIELILLTRAHGPEVKGVLSFFVSSVTGELSDC